jgi:hypothetical protein
MSYEDRRGRFSVEGEFTEVAFVSLPASWKSRKKEEEGAAPETFHTRLA